jgi:multidrug efflux pump subunit AcrB
MTMIVGIVTEVGVFYFAELTHEASPDTASLIRAGTLRMRPILMTSIIAVLALLPLALGLGGGRDADRTCHQHHLWALPCGAAGATRDTCCLSIAKPPRAKRLSDGAN